MWCGVAQCAWCIAFGSSKLVGWQKWLANWLTIAVTWQNQLRKDSKLIEVNQ